MLFGTHWIVGMSLTGDGSTCGAPFFGIVVVGFSSTIHVREGCSMVYVDGWIVRIVYGTVGSTDVVSGLPTLKLDLAFTLKVRILSICSGVHLLSLGVWRLKRTLVRGSKLLQ